MKFKFWIFSESEFLWIISIFFNLVWIYSNFKYLPNLRIFETFFSYKSINEFPADAKIMGLELLWLSDYFNNLIGKYQVVYHCTESICIQAKAASSRLPRHNGLKSNYQFFFTIFLQLFSCIKLSTECFIVFSWKHWCMKRPF